MPAPQGYCTYPGVASVLGATYTMAHGITPGVINLDIAPQAGPVAAIGNVIFFYGNLTLTLLDCKADMSSSVRGTGGTLVSLSLLDRRWRWRYGEMYGHYNERDADGKVIADTEKTPRELANLLLTQMGEYCDVSEIPNDARDEVEWVGENPAEELQSLLERLGCTIVLRPDQTIAIHAVGSGAALPVNAYLIEQQVDTNPPDVPATIRVVGGSHRFQGRLTLEPVGYELDGTIKHIDDLSYKPNTAAGWGGESEYFSGITDPAKRELAIKNVFRLYRIQDINSKTSTNIINLPSIGNVQKRREILPLMQGLVESVNNPDGTKSRKPERVMGIYFIRNLGSPENSTYTSNYEYPGTFQVDYDRGLVLFPEPVYKWYSSTKLWQPPELKLECSFAYRSLTLGSTFRYTYTIPTNAATGSGVDVVRREEIVREQYEKYFSNAGTPSWYDKIPTADLDAQGAHYAYGRLQSYILSSGATGKYAGLQPFACDGAITQVTWSVDGTGTFTAVSRLAEPHPYVPPFKQRRIVEGNRKQRFKKLGNERGRK